jgi:hypothetical protein
LDDLNLLAPFLEPAIKQTQHYRFVSIATDGSLETLRPTNPTA